MKSLDAAKAMANAAGRQNGDPSQTDDQGEDTFESVVEATMKAQNCTRDHAELHVYNTRPDLRAMSKEAA